MDAVYKFPTKVMKKDIFNDDKNSKNLQNLNHELHTTNKSITKQKQPCRDVLRKKCYEKMQQVYRRTLMLKCDFNKVAKQLQ